MLARMTKSSERALKAADEQARLEGRSSITPAFLALGVIQTPGLGATAMHGLGLSDGELRARLGRVQPELSRVHGGRRLPFDHQAKTVLGRAALEASQLGDGFVGTEHLLLALLWFASTDAHGMDEYLGVDLEVLRRRVLQLKAHTWNGDLGRSPAANEALHRAYELAGSDAMTTGHLLGALVGDELSQAGRVLRSLGVTEEAVIRALGAVPPDRTSDIMPSHDEGAQET